VTSPLLQTAPLSNLDSVLQPVDAMIGEVASLVGGEEDPLTRAKALVLLDRAADRMNMAGVFMFARKIATYDSLTASQATLDLPADWGWPTDPADVYDTSGNLIKRLEWKTWDIFKAVSISSHDGVPSLISMLSTIDGSAYIFPHIDVGSVGSIQLNYWMRVQRPSEHAEISILPEAREAMITTANFLMAQYRYLKYPNIWRPMQEDAFNTIEGAKAASNRWLGTTHPAAYPDLSGYALQYAEHAMTNSRIGLAPSYIKVG